MTKRMLIDAAHPEETRVVVLQDRQLLDFDYESATKKQLKGNIYLAKITRVEPSLQAAFIEYGGNRHGFLAFSEIHPDYYQIPASDRAKLEELEREATARAAPGEPDGNGRDPAREAAEDAGEANGHDERGEATELTQDADEETAEVVDELARRRARFLRSYKIQEVIKRRQIMLVQVVKEERGNKGAALTTYLSLAGRYCVLMPNTPRGGGISRKIASADDRRRLKSIAGELEVPTGMGLIIRTAGAERTKPEIKRDYEYLIRTWNEIRETTLKSVAPALIYEEGSLIKRALRDLYTRDIEEVLIEGEEGFQSARRLMQMLMPTRAKVVRAYEDEAPLFFSHQVEEQLDRIYSPVVHLPAGGSIVIHTTEALTAIDVNSGRSTRERHIDETAVKTNLEAADEIARQLRLRDLAGLIVIDFIDMAEGRHQRSVEKRLRDALKIDRARIQLGKISVFGLLELSRQRLRPSILELSTQACPVCAGAGVVRSTESCALQALRAIQEVGLKGDAALLRVGVPTEVGLYLLNHKREMLVRLEQRYAMRVQVVVSDDIHPPHMALDVVEKREQPAEAELAAGDEVRGREERARDDRPRDGRGGRDRDLERGGVTRSRPARDAEPVVEDEVDADGRGARDAGPAPVSVASPAERPEVAAAPERGAGDEGDEGGLRKRRRRRRRRRRGGEAGAGQPVAGVAGDAMGAEGTGEEYGADEAEDEEDVPVEPAAAGVVALSDAGAVPGDGLRLPPPAPMPSGEAAPPEGPSADTVLEPRAAEPGVTPAPKRPVRRRRAAAPSSDVASAVEMPMPVDAAQEPTRPAEAAPAPEESVAPESATAAMPPRGRGRGARAATAAPPAAAEARPAATPARRGARAGAAARAAAASPEPAADAAPPVSAKPKRRRAATPEAAPAAPGPAAVQEPEPAAPPRRAPARRRAKVEPGATGALGGGASSAAPVSAEPTADLPAPDVASPETADDAPAPDEGRPARRGWWRLGR